MRPTARPPDPPTSGVRQGASVFFCLLISRQFPFLFLLYYFDYRNGPLTSSRGESLPVGQASEIQLRIQVGDSYPSHHSAHSVRFDDAVRSTAGRPPSASPARDVEHGVYATASRPPLFVNPPPTALQLHAATAHTDRRRMCSCRTQELPRTDPPIQCIDIKLTGA